MSNAIIVKRTVPEFVYISIRLLLQQPPEYRPFSIVVPPRVAGAHLECRLDSISAHIHLGRSIAAHINLGSPIKLFI